MSEMDDLRTGLANAERLLPVDRLAQVREVVAELAAILQREIGSSTDPDAVRAVAGMLVTGDGLGDAADQFAAARALCARQRAELDPDHDAGAGPSLGEVRDRLPDVELTACVRDAAGAEILVQRIARDHRRLNGDHLLHLIGAGRQELEQALHPLAGIRAALDRYLRTGCGRRPE